MEKEEKLLFVEDVQNDDDDPKDEDKVDPNKAIKGRLTEFIAEPRGVAITSSYKAHLILFR